jgi:hypothetical protein
MAAMPGIRAAAVRGYLTGVVAAAVSFGGGLGFQAAFGEYGGARNCGDFLCGPFVSQRTSLALLANSALVIAGPLVAWLARLPSPAAYLVPSLLLFPASWAVMIFLWPPPLAAFAIIGLVGYAVAYAATATMVAAWLNRWWRRWPLGQPIQRTIRR